MAKSGQARVLTVEQFHNVCIEINKHRHKEKNMAILMISFRLGLRAQEIALLQIKEVAKLEERKMKRRSFKLKELMVLPAAYTKGANAVNRNPSQYIPRRISLSTYELQQMITYAINLYKSGSKIDANELMKMHPPKRRGGQTRELPMVCEQLQRTLKAYLKVRLKNDPHAKPEDPLFLSQKKTPYSPNTMAKHLSLMLKEWGNVEKASSHSGRRTLLTEMIIRQNVSVRVAQKIAGHKNVSTTLEYAEPSELDIAFALEAASKILPSKHKTETGILGHQSPQKSED